MIDLDDDQEPPPGSEAERLLGPSIDATVYPKLAAALAAADAPALRRELMQLLAPLLRRRAPRHSVRAICRLEGPDYNEPVLIKDISVSGVRFLVQSDASLDLTRFAKMSLHVRTSTGRRTMEVSLVRRCGGDQRHTDLACVFMAPAPDHPQTVADIRSHIFEDEPRAAVSA